MKANDLSHFLITTKNKFAEICDKIKIFSQNAKRNSLIFNELEGLVPWADHKSRLIISYSILDYEKVDGADKILCLY